MDEDFDPACYEGVALEVELPDALEVGFGGPQDPEGVHVWSEGAILGLRPEQEVRLELDDVSRDRFGLTSPPDP